MKEYNLILVYDKNEENILMCKRAKEPYMGKYNLVGGKINPGENKMDAAYRELNEETGISKSDINLTYILNFEYPMNGTALEVYAGKLNKNVKLVEETPDLLLCTLTLGTPNNYLVLKLLQCGNGLAIIFSFVRKIESECERLHSYSCNVGL